MAAAAAVIVSIGAAVSSAVGAVVSVVAATVGSVIAGAIATVSSAAGAITAALSSTVGQVVTTVGSAVSAVTSALKTGIADLAAKITKPLEPILVPIKDSLQAIYDYTKTIQTWINTQLAPVKELVALIDTITGLAVIRDLTSGIDAVGKLLGDVADGKSESTAAAIAELLKGITKTTVGVLDSTRQQYVALADRIEYFDHTIRASFDKRMIEMESTMYATIAGVQDELTGRSVTVQRQVTAISRRLEDLPWFASMLVRVLS